MLRERWPRLVSLALGGWFILSTLAFHTETEAGFNRLMIGIFVACCALMSLWAPWFRFVNLGFGVWMMIFAEVFEHESLFLQLSTLAAGGALVVFSALRSPPLLVDPSQAYVDYRP